MGIEPHGIEQLLPLQLQLRVFRAEVESRAAKIQLLLGQIRTDQLFQHGLVVRLPDAAAVRVVARQIGGLERLRGPVQSLLPDQGFFVHGGAEAVREGLRGVKAQLPVFGLHIAVHGVGLIASAVEILGVPGQVLRGRHLIAVIGHIEPHQPVGISLLHPVRGEHAALCPLAIALQGFLPADSEGYDLIGSAVLHPAPGEMHRGAAVAAEAGQGIVIAQQGRAALRTDQLVGGVEGVFIQLLLVVLAADLAAAVDAGHGLRPGVVFHVAPAVGTLEGLHGRLLSEGHLCRKAS